jgi:thiol-disulfide isomerase/thioredoxin
MSDDVDHERRRFLASAALSIAAGRFGVNLSSRALSIMTHPADTAVQVLGDGELRSLDDATEWLNSPPQTAAGLRGKVVLIDFWTYTCINWLRTLPYVRAWSDKYKDRGLVVVGVHTPEFGFEHTLDNVRRSVKDMMVPYPVVIDNDYSIWNAFRNNYWPALYLVDAKGRVRYHHFGEGEYAQSEREIQRLLNDAGARDIGHDLVSVEGRGAEADADWRDLRSQETYVGYGRTINFASPGRAAIDTPHVYTAPARLEMNHWSLSGDWTVGEQAIVLNKANGSVAYRFHARDLHLVMGPSRRGAAVPFRVRIDGQPPGAAHGLDVDDQGNGVAREQGMYQLIRQPKPINDRQFEIEFLEPGMEVFSFTFG